MNLTDFMQSNKNRRPVAQHRVNSKSLPIVMTAKVGTVDTIDRTDGFVEKKLDGTRTILIKKLTGVRIFNGRGKQTERTERYPKIVSDGEKLNCETCILDGELVFYDARGRVVFLNSSATRETVKEKSLKFKYMVFDIIEKDGRDLRNLDIEERKQILDDVVPDRLTIIDETKIIRKNKRKFLEQQLNDGQEGVMFKENHSKYNSSGEKSSKWLKIKKHDSLDVIAKGMTMGDGVRATSFGALRCYLPNGRGGFRYIGKVGGGFKNSDIKEVLPYARSGKPFVIEVGIMEWTPDGKMRMASFVRLRLDKTIEEVGING